MGLRPALQAQPQDGDAFWASQVPWQAAVWLHVAGPDGVPVPPHWSVLSSLKAHIAMPLQSSVATDRMQGRYTAAVKQPATQSLETYSTPQ
jgi:hypothetical protein